MKLHVNVLVPMGCPCEGCDGEDFIIERSHPFGDTSKTMDVRCKKCNRRFYTSEGGPAKPYQKLMARIEELKAKG